MNAQTMTQFFLGGASMACVVVGLFFLRFWRKTGDRLFMTFSLAFWILGLNWMLLGLIAPEDEDKRALFYVLRLVAFALIIFAIIDKNRATRRQE